MKNPLLLFVLFCGLSFSACEKDKTPPTELEKLPAATQEGKQTFGCLVNGKAWTPKGSLIRPGIEPYYDEHAKAFQVHAVFKEQESFRIVLTDVFQADNYSPLPHFSYYSIASDQCSILGFKEYQVLDGGNVQVTFLDIEKGIVSGTFEFNVINETCLDTLHITNGRFDTRYKF